MKKYREFKKSSDITNFVLDGDLTNISATQGYECIQLLVDKYTCLIEIVLVNVGSFTFLRKTKSGAVSEDRGFIHSINIEEKNSIETLNKLTVDMDSQLVVYYELGLYREQEYREFSPWMIDNPDSNNPDNDADWLSKNVFSKELFRSRAWNLYKV